MDAELVRFCSVGCISGSLYQVDSGEDESYVPKGHVSTLQEGGDIIDLEFDMRDQAFDYFSLSKARET